MVFTSKVCANYTVIAESSVSAAGGIFYAESTGRVCIARRSGAVDVPYTWATWGGKLDEGETPEITVKREIVEEAGYTDAFTLKHVHTFRSSKLTYDTFFIIVQEEFEPTLNWENIDFRWTTLDTLPVPLHPGLKASLSFLKQKLPKAEDL